MSRCNPRSNASLIDIPFDHVRSDPYFFVLILHIRTAVKPTSGIAIRRPLMRAQDNKSLHCSNTWSIQFDFQKSFGPIREELGQGFRERDKSRMVTCFEGASDSTPRFSCQLFGLLFRGQMKCIHRIRKHF